MKLRRITNWLMSCGTSRSHSLSKTYTCSNGSTITNTLHLKQQLVSAPKLLLQKAVICRWNFLRFPCFCFRTFSVHKLFREQQLTTSYNKHAHLTHTCITPKGKLSPFPNFATILMSSAFECIAFNILFYPTLHIVQQESHPARHNIVN